MIVFIKFKLVAFMMLMLLIMQSGFAQKSTALINTPSYQLTIANKDTLVQIIMSKKQAMWFRLYITELEHTTIDYSLLLKKSQLLETKISLLEKEKSNISEQFNLAIKTIDIQKNIIDTQEDMYTHKLKYKYREGVKNGVIGGLVGGIIICLLIK